LHVKEDVVPVVLVVLTFLVAGLAAATEVPAGPIEADTTWTLVDSPYTANHTFSLSEGVVLTVEPGVTLELGEAVDFFVYGELRMSGSEEEPIVVTGLDDGSGPARWGAFIFEESCVSAQFEHVDEYVGGTVLEHVVFEFGTRALRVGGPSPYIHACEFRLNLVDESPDSMGGPAIVVRQGSAPRIVDCHFHDNEAADPYWGGAIFVHDAAPVIQGNVFEDNQSAYGGALVVELMYSPIVDNVFTGNVAAGEGGAVSMVSSSLAFLGNEVSDNESWWADGGGVHVCVDCSPHAAPMMLDNVIVGNRALYHGAGGVGAAYIRAFSYNELHGNTMADEPSDFGWFNDYDDPDWVRYPSIPNNWWGTTDLEAIGDAIHDGEDDSIYGIVDVDPILDGPPESGGARALITTRRIEYDGAGETMPTFLTLYNPGDERAVDVAILVQIGEMPPVPYLGPIGFPGAELSVETWRLILPEGVAFSTELQAPVYQVPEGVEYAVWHVVMFDAQSGERIGDVSSARCDFGERGES